MLADNSSIYEYVDIFWLSLLPTDNCQVSKFGKITESKRELKLEQIRNGQNPQAEICSVLCGFQNCFHFPDSLTVPCLLTVVRVHISRK